MRLTDAQGVELVNLTRLTTRDYNLARISTYKQLHTFYMTDDPQLQEIIRLAARATWNPTIKCSRARDITDHIKFLTPDHKWALWSGHLPLR